MDLGGHLKALARAELRRTQSAARRWVVQVVLMLVALLFGVFAVAMLGVAVFVALARTYGPVTGALITAAILLLIAVLVALLAGPISRRRKAKQESAHAVPPPEGARARLEADAAEAESLARELRDEAGRWAQQTNPKIGIAALVFGIAVGASPRLRRLLRALLK